MAGRGQVRMEIVVERHAYPEIVSCELQDVCMLGPIHADLRDMLSVEAILAKNQRSMRGKPLIEEKSSHATRWVLSRSSSTAAAA